VSAAVDPNGAAARADAAARQRIRNDFDTTFFVEAAAGTGKTTELIARIVALIRAGVTTLDRVVAVTFTEKAAGEMKLRLRSEIESARAAADGGVRERLDHAAGQLEVTRIGTIHGFCADLLRERPVEAGIDPLFEVAAEEESARLLDRAFERWFQTSLDDPPEGVRRVLRRRPRGFAATSPRDALRSAANALVEHRDFPTAWRRDPFDRDRAIDAVLERLADVGALAERAEWRDDYLARNLAEIRNFADDNALREAVRGRDYDGLEAELRELARGRTVHWNWKGSPRRPYAKDLPRADVIARRDEAKDLLDRFLADADADLAPLLQAELRPVISTYEQFKRRAGQLDFLDLLVCARDLLRDEEEIRRGMQERFTHYFVDEFQDTDPLQAEILLLLTADDGGESDWRRVAPRRGALFVVGDPKQSIYRFRRADVGVYDAVRRQLAARGAAELHLSVSFRGLPPLQQAINAAFAPLMSGGEDGAQAHYVPLSPYRARKDAQPALVALPVPRPYGDYGTVVRWKIEESLPHAVGAFVDWLVRQSGWTVQERGAAVPVKPRHVCLLFRRFRRFRDDMTRDYVRALEVRQIPHVLVGGRSFHDREEVLALRNALCAIEWPDDELRVFATLRGPFFALGDDALLAFRDRFRSLHPLRRLDPAALDEADAEVAAALDVLARLHVERNRRPLAATLTDFLAAVRAHAGVAIWPTGEQALANCLRVVDRARRFERGGAPSFRAFVETMEDEAERGAAEEAPAVEEGTEGVRIMTVHRAKGLEFPVVVLVDPTCRASHDQPSRHIDPERRVWLEPLCGCVPPELREAAEAELRRDRAEAVRIAYVAATRARDLLVLPVVGDEDGNPGDGWTDMLRPAFYPATADRRQPNPSPGCPAFGADSVLERPEQARGGTDTSVAPGGHRPLAGEHTVVWWDPAVLELDREQTVGLRQQRLLEADAGEVKANAGIRAHAAWQEARRCAVDGAARATIRSRTVTAWATATGGAVAPPPIDVEVVEVAGRSTERPAGKRFGALVHAVLATVALGAGAKSVRAHAAAQARLLGAGEEEAAAAAVAVRAALGHPLLKTAASCASRGALRRETPVLLRRDDGELLEGVVDLAYRDGDTWTVVDFKTDRELGEHRAEYERQVALYAEAITRATGEKARAVLLIV
jgi:ATP-dependent exoDNAse (exonuclease V) beta subunit